MTPKTHESWARSSAHSSRQGSHSEEIEHQLCPLFSGKPSCTPKPTEDRNEVIACAIKLLTRPLGLEVGTTA